MSGKIDPLAIALTALQTADNQMAAAKESSKGVTVKDLQRVSVILQRGTLAALIGLLAQEAQRRAPGQVVPVRAFGRDD